MPSRSIPAGYAEVDPRTARRISLSQLLGPSTPLFPGDPPTAIEPWATVADDGFAVEHLTSLGTHTGTHVSVPSHALEGGASLSDLDETWTLMPLAVVDVRDRVYRPAAGLSVSLDLLQSWELQHGELPRGGCLLLLTGFAERYRGGGGYERPAPGLTADAVAWLFDERGLRAIGSDSFGPDAGDDPSFSASLTALGRGGVTIENVGPGLASMRPHGDWVGVNCARGRWSGFPAGVTGFTTWG